MCRGRSRGGRGWERVVVEALGVLVVSMLMVRPVSARRAAGDGRLSEETPTVSPTPVAVVGLPAAVVAIAAGGYHSLALDANGIV